MKKVSIVVTVYNTSKYLRKCLDSLVNQTYKDFEIIIINDGSTDNSLDIIMDYKNKYEFITVYTTKNGGRAKARNYGISKVNTEFFMFVDSDDYIDLSMLSSMMKLVSSKTDIVVCDGMRVTSFVEKETISFFSTYVKEKNKCLMVSHPGPCGKIYRTKLFKDNKLSFPCDVKLYEDLALIPRLGLYTNNIEYIQKPFYKYVINEGSAMQQTSLNSNFHDIFKVLEILYNNLGDYPMELEYLYIEHMLRSASLRYISFKGTNKYLNLISNIMHEKFPNYRKNIYYKKKSYKFKIVCFLAYYRLFFLLRFLNKLFN